MPLQNKHLTVFFHDIWIPIDSLGLYMLQSLNDELETQLIYRLIMSRLAFLWKSVVASVYHFPTLVSVSFQQNALKIVVSLVRVVQFFSHIGL